MVSRQSGTAKRPRRYEPRGAYALADLAKRRGVDLPRVRGPWRPNRRALLRPGRNSSTAIPVVTNGVTEVAVDTPERAADLSGFLNWCGVDELNPVQGLSPPQQDLAAE
jgi:hypothetical protein